MMKQLCFCVFLVLFIFTVEVKGYGEEITTEGVPYPIPTWQGRASHLLLNMLRVGMLFL